MLKATSLDHFAWKDIAQIQYCMKSSRSMAQMLWATPPNMFGCMHDRSVMDNQSRGPNVFVQIIWALFLVRNSWPPPHSKSKTKRNGLPSYDSLILVTTSPMSPLFAEGILGVRSFASKSSPAPTNWSSTGQVVSGPVMSLVVRSMVGQGKKI